MAENNDWDLDDGYVPPNTDTGTAQPGNPKGSKEPEPTKLSRGATGLLIVGVLIVVALILITIKGCSVEKTVNTSSTQGTVNSGTPSEVLTSENSGLIEVNNSEISSNFSDVSSTPTESVKEENISQTTVESTTQQVNTSVEESTPSVDTDNTDALEEVNMPKLSTEIDTTGIVIGKHVFSYKGSYIYGVYISILYGEETKSVYYFCPKKTFDALNSADTVNVTYALDNAGSVSITTISK